MEEEQRIKREEFERELGSTRLEQSSAEQQERASREIVQQIPLWDDKTDPEAFTEAFVMAMTEAKWPEEQWIPTLRKWLTGNSGGSRICERGFHKCQNFVDTPTS